MKVVIKNYTNHYCLSYKIANIFKAIVDDDMKYVIADKIEGIPGYSYFESLSEKYSEWKESRRVSVKIDSWDTYSMDSTLSYIILPMLKQIRTELNSAPRVDFKDADPEFHPFEADIKRMETEPGWTDDNFFKRWENVLDKMIEAFELHQEDDVYSADSEDSAKLEDGLRLFGKYYRNLWT